MTVWAIADLHLSFGVPNKEMDVFGERWIGYLQKLHDNWTTHIKNEDLVLIPGDISWAMHPEQVKADFDWIHQLPGTKVMVRGNHDYWWTSLSKVEKVLPSSIHLIQNNSFQWQDISIAGTRLWDTPEFSFGPYIQMQPNAREKPLTEQQKDPEEAERIFQRELARLELSLKCLDRNPKNIRIVMTHYPPIGADLKDSRAAKILERNQINICVFGHLHNVTQGIPMFGKKNGVQYYLTATDYLDHMPLKLF